MVTEGTEVKILGQTKTLLSLLSELRQRLEASFESVPKDSAKGTPDAESHANVLDDVQSNLEDACRRVKQVDDFVVNNVIKKIH